LVNGCVYTFINDGSLYYGNVIKGDGKDIMERLEQTFTHISKGRQHFRYSRNISKRAFLHLDLFLQECRRRRIYVIGILPPYPNVVYRKLRMLKVRYGYLTQLTPAMEQLFNRYQYAFFDFSDMAAVGSPDSEAIDGNHGSEKTYLKVFLMMAMKNKYLRRFAKDLGYLKTRLLESDNKFSVFDINEF